MFVHVHGHVNAVHTCMHVCMYWNNAFGLFLPYTHVYARMYKASAGTALNGHCCMGLLTETVTP